jgi:hypothetical protein
MLNTRMIAYALAIAGILVSGADAQSPLSCDKTMNVEDACKFITILTDRLKNTHANKVANIDGDFGAILLNNKTPSQHLTFKISAGKEYKFDDTVCKSDPKHCLVLGRFKAKF